jgi:hypothetical protein
MTAARTVTGALISFALVGLGVGACGGQPAVCDDVQSLQTSWQDIKRAKPGEGGLSTITTELDTMQTTVKQLGADASSQYSSQVKAVRASTATLGSSVESATSNPTSASIAQVANDVRAVGQAIEDLGTALSNTC